jgi:hypothetical protein
VKSKHGEYKIINHDAHNMLTSKFGTFKQKIVFTIGFAGGFYAGLEKIKNVKPIYLPL